MVVGPYLHNSFRWVCTQVYPQVFSGSSLIMCKSKLIELFLWLFMEVKTGQLRSGPGMVSVSGSVGLWDSLPQVVMVNLLKDLKTAWNIMWWTGWSWTSIFFSLLLYCITNKPNLLLKPQMTSLKKSFLAIFWKDLAYQKRQCLRREKKNDLQEDGWKYHRDQKYFNGLKDPNWKEVIL